jgi:glycosyltransferase involved in cell wall biosynthesis
MDQDRVDCCRTPRAELDGVDSASSADTRHSSLLLVLPLPVRYDEQGQLMIESQAANGLERWAENFDKITAACVLTPSTHLQARSSWTWRPVQDVACADRVKVVPLPWAYRPSLFLRHYRQNRKLLRSLIEKSSYLVFGIGYTWGDWASLGCLEAIRQRRPYAVWTDLVDHQVIRFDAEKKSLLRRIYRKYVDASLVKHYHHFLISRSRLGLFHGADCFDAYAPVCSNPHVVHDIHLKPQDAIPARRLESKADEIRQRGRLRLGYVGRADASKGAMDWLEVIKILVNSGVDVKATWLGDGPLLAELRGKAQQMGLSDRVRFPGFVADRGQVLEFLMNCHLLVYCHKVPESPRVLIESLVCGTPIVGYDSPYPRDLIGGHDWGRLTPRHDVAALAEVIGQLDRDRESLAEMVNATSSSAPIFNDEAVFRHRSELIKKYL